MSMRGLFDLAESLVRLTPDMSEMSTGMAHGKRPGGDSASASASADTVSFSLLLAPPRIISLNSCD